MKKITLITALLFVFAGISHAQNETSYSVAANLGIAGGDAADVLDYGMGFGASFSYEIKQDAKLAYGGSAGLLYFSGEPFDGVESTTTNIPVTAFGKYYVQENLYGVARAGYNIVSSSISGNGFTGSGSDSGVTYGVGVGFLMSGLDISAGFDFLAQDFTSITFGVGYQF